jgi:acyl-CoA synthetase (NDP forming)/GNAT superfamily N-acetyltransferase
MSTGAEPVRSLLADGSMVTVRELTPADRDQVATLHESMPEEDRYLRFFTLSLPSTDTFITKVTSLDQDDHGSVGVFDGETLLGTAAYVVIKGSAPVTGDIALVVSHRVQHHGVGTVLLEHLGSLARGRGVRRFSADVLPANWRMLEVFSHVGLAVHMKPDFDVIEVNVDLDENDHYLDVVSEWERVADEASLQSLLRPRSVTVIGAGRKPESIGHAALSNILAGGFTGEITAVNPHANEVLGVRSYASVLAIPDTPELAVLCVPASAVPDVAAECGRAGVRALLVISSGLSTDPALAQRLLKVVREYGMRMVGPNCLGVVNTEPAVRLDASFARGGAVEGGVGVVTQSGGIAIAVLEQLRRLDLGVSTLVSTGDKYDVSGNDMLHWWSGDYHTRIAVLYMESFGNPRKFSRLARHLARSKPVLAVRSGSSEVGQRAAASHTAATATPTVLRDALFRQAGVIAVDRLSELTETIAVLAGQPLPAGNRVAVVSNAGGAGVLAVDACVQNGLLVPELSQQTRDELRATLPALASISNPVDTTAVVAYKVFAHALRSVLADPGIDAVIAIAAPTALGDPAGAIVTVETDKPLLAVRVDQSSAIDWLGGLPCFADSAAAAAALGHAAERAAWLRRPPGTVPDLPDIDATAARGVVRDYLAANPEGGWLGPEEVLPLLRAFGLPMLGEVFALDAEAAVDAWRGFGTPVAAKAVAAGLLHKSRGGGVRLGLGTERDVRVAVDGFTARFGTDLHGVLVQPMVPPGRELLIGVSSDTTFGPLVVFGLGGVDTDMINDRTARLVPVTDVDADEMLGSIRSAPKLFTSTEDKDAARDVLLRVARLAELLPEIAELDINPLVVGEHGGIIVDVRVRVIPVDYVDPFLRRMR